MDLNLSFPLIQSKKSDVWLISYKLFKIGQNRWSCCDSIHDTPFGRDGCQRRFHMRPLVDEEYRKKADSARKESQRLEKIEKNNTRIALEAEDIIREKMKANVHKSEDKIAKQQAIVKRWDSIKFK